MHLESLFKSMNYAAVLIITLTTVTLAQDVREGSRLPELLSAKNVDAGTIPRFRDPAIGNKLEPSKETGSTQTAPAAEVSPRQNQGYVRPGAKKRFKRYTNSIIGPASIAGNAFGAGFSTLTNSPEEWGKNVEGFGKRFASGFGTGVIKNTTIYGLDEALKLDSHFYKSKNRSTGARIKNALLSPVTAYDKNGKRVVGVPRIVGTYGAAVIARETWYPDRYNYKDGLKSGTISLGVNAAFNLVKEFVF